VQHLANVASNSIEDQTSLDAFKTALVSQHIAY